jgi:plasmid stability protein
LTPFSARAAMPTITIRNVPERLHARLAARAAARGKSPDEEALSVLDAALAAPDPLSPAPAEIVAQLDAIRQRSSYEAAPGEIEAVLRELRESR